MPRKSIPQPRKAWWTRVRMVEAGAFFFRNRKVAPTNEGWWNAETRFTARTQRGLSNQGRNRPYPSVGALKKYWKSLREFWQEVALAYPELGIALDRGDVAWSALEEWFITETVGLVPRTEVARLMNESGLGRTDPAIKRRLYELGVNTYNRWGWTVNHLARLTGVSGTIIAKYINHGLLPFFQGNKCLYIDPADFPVIQEYDWNQKDQPAELDEAVRQALVRRLCYVLLGFDYRRYSYHKIQARRSFKTGNKMRSGRPPTEPRPIHVVVGDWVAITGEWQKQPGARGRIGQIKNLSWSPDRRAASSKNPARPACWIVTVEFRKLKAHGNTYPRVRYNVPAAAVTVVDPPNEEPETSGERRDVPTRDRSRRKARIRRKSKQVLESVLPRG